jgi:hypothetical protein
MKSGGMFHLAKVNVDKSRDIVDTLKVTGFPTVFATNKGKFTDRFVGLLQPDMLEQFIVRAVTGYGEPVQGDISAAELDAISMQMNNLAGLASISFKKKESLHKQVDQALAGDDAWQSTASSSIALSEGVRTAMLYLNKVQGDIRNPKYRVIQTSSKIFSEKVQSCTSAKAILQIAGFRLAESSTGYELQHSNTALLSLVIQRVNEKLKEKKFSHLKSSASAGAPSSQPTSMPTSEPGSILVSLKSKNGLPKKKSFSRSMMMEEVVRSLMSINEMHKLSSDVLANRKLTIQANSASKSYLMKEIRMMRLQELLDALELDDESNVILSLEEEAAVSSSSKPSRGRRSLRQHRFSHGGHMSDAKFNEYFGGDSTLTLAGDEEEEESNTDDEEDEDIINSVSFKHDDIARSPQDIDNDN